MKKADLPIDKLSVYRETRRLKDKTYNMEDGAAGIEVLYFNVHPCYQM